MRTFNSVAILAFALEAIQAQQVFKNLYSDAFIAENAFQPDSNQIPFDLRPL